MYSDHCFATKGKFMLIDTNVTIFLFINYRLCCVSIGTFCKLFDYVPVDLIFALLLNKSCFPFSCPNVNLGIELTGSRTINLKKKIEKLKNIFLM